MYFLYKYKSTSQNCYIMLEMYNFFFTEYILDEAKVTVKVGTVTGIPMPLELQVFNDNHSFYVFNCHFVDHHYSQEFMATYYKYKFSILFNKDCSDAHVEILFYNAPSI